MRHPFTVWQVCYRLPDGTISTWGAAFKNKKIRDEMKAKAKAALPAGTFIYIMERV